MTQAAPVTATPRAGWLFGPGPDLLIGCGLGYLAIFVVLAVAGTSVREVIPLGALVLGTLFAGTPHYGATLLRVYERADDRRRYVVFSVWASLAIALLFVGGLHDADLRSLINTVYLTWSPYHYTGQNYGIALMLLGRAGVSLQRPEKRLVHASFLLSFLLIFLASHGDAQPVSYAPQVDKPDNVRFVSLGIPYALRNVLLGVAALAYVATLLGSARALLRRGSLRAVAPAACLFLTQAVWFSIPAFARATSSFQDVLPLSRQFAVYSFLWIAYGHSLQYLWVTGYYARRREPEASHVRFYTKALLAGAAIWGLPALLFMPDALGPLSHEAGLALMIGACVNLHHFVLDGAIWKLRDGRVARVLLRAESSAAAPSPVDAPKRRWLRPAIFAAGAVCVAINLAADAEWYFAYKPALARGDVARVETAEQRMRWLGRESPLILGRLGELHAKAKRPVAARSALERSLALKPTSRTWLALGDLEARSRRPRMAIAAYDAAIALTPSSVPANYRAGMALLRIDEQAQARERFERVLELEPDHEGATRALEQLDGDNSSDESVSPG